MSRGATRRAFLKGLAALLPTVLTILIIYKAYEFVSSTAGAWLTKAVAWVWAGGDDTAYQVLKDRVPPVVGTLLALVLAFLVAVFVGLVLASFIGRTVWGVLEKRVFNFPVIRLIYPSVKQITDFIFGEQRMSFKRVGLVEYPRKGVYSIGFMTGEGFTSLKERTGREMVTFFIPSSPTPFTGYCVQLAREEVIELDMPVDAVLRYTVSGGVILPVSEGGTAEQIVSIPGASRAGGGLEADEQDNSQE